ncbi:MAG: hypothetical protein KatS3mg102_1495 [Planctomycetota bacterium]|nr:MAG: hypothetical protein KatS3mg102_1495 [Planctomycetota bacterium]
MSGTGLRCGRAVRAALAVWAVLAAAAPLAAALPAGAVPAAVAGGGHVGPDLRAVVVQLLGLLIIAVILFVWVFPLLGRLLARRREGIAEGFRTLEQRREQAQQGAAAARRQLAEAERHSLELIQQAERRGVELREQLVREGTTAADHLLKRARLEAEIERAKMLFDTRNEVVQLSLQAAAEALASRVDEAAQQALLERFFAELDALKV